GQVKFNENGARSDNVILYQQYRVLNGVPARYSFGYVSFETERSFFAFETGESSSTLWSDGVPPYDGFPVIGITTNSIALVVIYDIVAGIGIIFAIVCFIFNVIFRKKRIVKLTSPNLNHIIILGSVLLYISVIFYSISSMNKTIQSTFCNIRVWLFSLGYDLCFGVILSKTWRIYYIFHNPKPNKKGMKDWVLLFIVLLIISIDIIIILVGSTVPQSRLTSFEVAESGNSQEINV
uniref:G-protein coupled receptors family 3 profile domain-containing protein n=1 Tax=Amphimedon queenslandica TaxID=400682 RepID=A0A1X7SG58_AMPQE